MRLSNTWHLVRLWQVKSYCLAWSKRDLGVTSGCAGWQCQQCSPWPCQHVADSTAACVPVLYFCARQSHLILVTATKLFLYMTPYPISNLWSIQSLREGFVSKVQVSFLEKKGRGRRGGVNICNPVQRRQCLATLCLGLPLGQADWGISRLRQRLLTET